MALHLSARIARPDVGYSRKSLIELNALLLSLIEEFKFGSAKLPSMRCIV